MKLNLDFSKYIGKTRLKAWWREVKRHFEQTQAAHNALEDEIAAEKARLSTEINQRTTADVALGERIGAEITQRQKLDIKIQTEIDNRTEADNLIKEHIEEVKAEYLAEGSSAAFNWTGDDPEISLSEYGEATAEFNLSGMFTVDGEPCGEMATAALLLNSTGDTGKGNTYIIASFNLITKAISVTASDNRAESSVSNNVWTFTAASYYIDTTSNDSGGGYVIVGGSYTPCAESITIGKGKLPDEIEKIGKLLKEHENNKTNSHGVTKEQVGLGLVPNVTTNNQTPTFTTAQTRAELISGDKISVLFGKIKRWLTDLKSIAFSGSFSDLVDAPVNVSGWEITDSEIDEAYTGTVLTQTDTEDATINSQIKIRHERDVEHKYPNAVKGNTGSAVNGSEVFFIQDMMSVPNVLDFGDNYEFNVVNPMSIPENSTVYFKLLKQCVAEPDSYNSEPGEVQIIDVYSWHDAMYIKTDAGEEATKIATKPEVDKQIEQLMNRDEALADENSLIKTKLNQKRNSVTIVIGTANTVNADGNCDYICDGLNDEAEINAAIASLPNSGGKIILREGTYSISDTISIDHKNNITIEGMGDSTILMPASSLGTATAIDVTSGPQFKLHNLTINCSLNTTGTGSVLKIYRSNLASVEDVKFLNFAGTGLMFNLNKNCIFSKLLFKNGKNAIRATGTNHYCLLHSIIIDTMSATAISTVATDHSNIIHNCIMQTITGSGISNSANFNIFSNNTFLSCGRGISSSGANCEITGNLVSNADNGINIDGSDMLVADNKVFRSEYTSSQYTIYLTNRASNCLVCNNSIKGKDYVDNGTSNTFANNKV